MNPPFICPSILSANFACLGDEVNAQFEELEGSAIRECGIVFVV